MLEIRDIHEPFAKWLREQKIVFIRARSDKESTIRAGWPDFTILSPVQSPLLLEMKTDKAALSAIQRECHKELQNAGFRVFVVRNVANAIELVTEWRSMVTMSPPADKSPRLRVFANAVVQWNTDKSSWDFVRVATDADKSNLMPIWSH